MKKIFQHIALVFILLATLFANAQAFSSVPVWSDEFSGNNILPDATVWNNEIGMIRNAELQYYTNRDIDNQVLVNDELHIIGKRENFGGARYTSASLTSKPAWKYGKIEGRIKMETGMGIWGCFWTLGRKASWPHNGEIDIIEHINNEAGYHATAHWWNETLSTPNKHLSDGSDVPDPVGSYNANDYNIYSIEWTPSYIKWFVNNNLVKTMSILNGIRGTWEFHAPQYILLNCPIGGKWPQDAAGASWNEALIVLPNTMAVDYVRVYSYISDAPPAPLSLRASTITQTSFNLDWSASLGATSYDVVLENKGKIYTYGPFSSTTCTITGLTANTNYSVRVKARNVTTNSSDFAEFSDPLFVTTSSFSISRPIVDLQFNENTGTSTANAGFIGGFLNFNGKVNWSTNTPANNRKRTSSISVANNKDGVQTPFIVDELIGLNDITITGWLNCKNATETNASGNRIVNTSSAKWFDATIGTDGIDLVYRSDGTLQLGINESVKTTSPKSTIGKITTDPAAGAANWKFFAVTYSATSQSVKFYFGNSSTDATLDKTVPYSRGALGRNVGPLAIGNFNSITSSWQNGAFFNGLIDQIQIYNSSLTLPQIIDIQQVMIPVSLANVIVTPEIVNLNAVGATLDLTATITPSSCTNKTINWKSSDPNVVLVDSFGQITAVGTGKAIVTAESEDGNISATSAITVNPFLDNIYEAENGGLNSSTGGTIKTLANASGGLVVGDFFINSAMNKISNINAGAGGSVDLIIRYSNGTGVAQTLTYFSYDSSGNPVKGSKVNFPPTANWNTFSEITFPIVLRPGMNQSFKLQKDNDGNGAGPNLDKYSLSFASVLSVPDKIFDSKIKVWPNPVRNQFYVLSEQGGNEGVSSIVVSDLNGKVIHFQQSNIANTVTIKTSGWTSGLYIVKVTNNEGQSVKKLIIQ